MKCVECGKGVYRLFEEPVKGNFVLTVCENCGKIADKFIEYEYTLICLNLILCKSQVYRHILFNTDFCMSLLEVAKIWVLNCLLDVIWAGCSEECWDWVLGRCIGKSVLYFGVIIMLARSVEGKVDGLRVIRAILIASFGKLGGIMIVTWNYSFFHRVTMMFFVYLNHVIAIKECLEIGALKAFGFVGLAGVVSSLNDFGIF
jgi:hypothetical protein